MKRPANAGPSSPHFEPPKMANHRGITLRKVFLPTKMAIASRFEGRGAQTCQAPTFAPLCHLRVQNLVASAEDLQGVRVHHVNKLHPRLAIVLT